MGQLSVLLADAAALDRLRTAVTPRFQLTLHSSWDDLVTRAPARNPEALIVDLFHPQGPRAIGPLTEKARDLGCGLVVCSDFRGRESDLLTLGLHDVRAALMLPSLGSLRKIEMVVERAIADAVSREVVEQIESRAPELAVRALEWAVRNASSGATAQGLAEAMASPSPKALSNRLREEGLPTIRCTLLWGRLMLAASLLERSADTVESVAQRVGYASRSGLTRALSKELGIPPSELALRGGSGTVVHHYLKDLAIA